MSAAVLTAAPPPENHNPKEEEEAPPVKPMKPTNGQSISTTFTPFEDVVGRAETRLKFIDDVGKRTPGVSPDCSPLHRPAWFDRKTFSRAQELYSTFGSVILYSQFYGLLTVYNIYEGLAPLLCTGNSATVPVLFSRYLSTVVQIKSWFEGDPFDPSSKAYKSLKVVRSYHRQVAAKLNEGKVEGKDELWMSQWSMMGAQFTFMGYMTVFPKELGFHCFSEADFHAIFHFWRVIGHCLGVEDRFNLCAGSDELIREMCHQKYWRHYHPMIVAAQEPTGIAMTKGITYAMRQMSFALNYEALLRYGAPFMDLDRKCYPLKGFVAKFAFGTLWLYFRLFTKSVILNWLFTKYMGFKLWMTVTRRTGLFRQLVGWYGNGERQEYSYENDDRCPVRVKFNYQDAFQLKLY